MRLDYDQIKAEAVGRWPGIFANLGIDVGDGRHQFCPACSPGEPNSDRFRFDDKEGKGTYYCNCCGAGDGVSLVMKVLNIDFKTAMEEISKVVGSAPQITHQTEKPVSPELLRKMYKESNPAMSGDLVSLYLKNRGLSSMPTTLRLSSKCWEAETKKEQSAMLATFSVPDGAAVTLHRTYLTEYGTKLDIKSPKKIMPPVKKMTGGACRLYKFESGVLGICEGIETAIAIHELMKEENNMPIWAALSATLLEKFQPPDNVKELYIFADNDKNYAGQKAAFTLAHRVLVNQKIPVHVHIPLKAGTDFLDELNN